MLAPRVALSAIAGKRSILVSGKRSRKRCRIVDVPAGHHEEHAGMVAEAGEEIVGQPVPRLVADEFGVGLRSPLDRVVDDAEVEALAGDLPVHRGVAEEPPSLDRAGRVVDEVGVAPPRGPRSRGACRLEHLRPLLAVERSLQHALAALPRSSA